KEIKNLHEQLERQVIFTHDEKSPVVHATAYVAPNATVRGDVTVGAGCRIMFGACVISEGQPLVLGENCIVMENAVIRSTSVHPTRIGAHCLVGPHAHLAGCKLDDCVFIATGARRYCMERPWASEQRCASMALFTCVRSYRRIRRYRSDGLRWERPPGCFRRSSTMQSGQYNVRSIFQSSFMECIVHRLARAT